MAGAWFHIAATRSAEPRWPAGARARSGALRPPSPSTAWQRAQPLSKKGRIPALASPGMKCAPGPCDRAASDNNASQNHSRTSAARLREIARERRLAMAVIAVCPRPAAFVALQAGVHAQHAKRFAGGHAQLLHGAVADGAVEPRLLDVPPMRKIDV